MTLLDFYLLCFLVGFLLAVLSLVIGQVHGHVHLPHVHGLNVHIGHTGGHAGAPAAHGGGAHAQAAELELSPFNFATFAAFLAWFGGAGYLLTRYWSFWYVFGLAIAAAFGLAGAAVVFWALSKLVRPDENLDPADYEMVGSLGRVVSTIREGGTGEIVYVQAGVRHTTGARSENGSAIAKETEVVITRYERGIAYVRCWDEYSDELAASAGEDSGTKEA